LRWGAATQQPTIDVIRRRRITTMTRRRIAPLPPPLPLPLLLQPPQIAMPASSLLPLFKQWQ